MEDKSEAQVNIKKESRQVGQRERREGASESVNRQEQAAEKKSEVKGEVQEPRQVKIKEEKLSQVVPEEENQDDVAASLFEVGFSRPTAPKRKTQVTDSLQVKEQQPTSSRVGDEESESSTTRRPENRKQATLHLFKKPKTEAEGAREDQRSRREEDVSSSSSLQVKEEPMDMGETEQDPVLQDRRVVQSLQEVEGTDDGGKCQERRTEDEKRSSKRKASRMDSDGGDGRTDNRGQTSRPRPKNDKDDGGSMWKKKARIDVFSQVLYLHHLCL